MTITVTFISPGTHKCDYSDCQHWADVKLESDEQPNDPARVCFEDEPTALAQFKYGNWRSV